MGYKIIVRQGSSRIDFDDVFGHSVGNSGAVQIREMNGDITILGSFDRLEVKLSEEEKANFRKQVEEAEALGLAQQAAQEAAQQEKMDAVEVDEEEATAEDFEALAEDAETVAEDARATAQEMREKNRPH